MRTFRVKKDGNPINETLNTGASRWQLECVKLHLENPGYTGDFTITVDSSNGSSFDMVLFRQDMTEVSDIVWIPEASIPFSKGDDLSFYYENAGNSGFGLEVFWGLK